MEKKSSLKKFLATASAFAVISGAATSAAAAAIQTTQNVGINAFATNGNWNNAPVAAGDSILLANVGDSVNIDAGPFYITAIDLNGKNNGGITVNTSGTQLGNVHNGGATGALTFAGAHEIILVGGSEVTRQAGGVAADYTGIEDIDFAANTASILSIDTRVQLNHPVSGNVAGNADAIDLAGTVANATDATLNVRTDLNVADESWGTIKTINIGEVGNVATFKIESNAGNIALNTAAANTVNFLHNDATLHLENTGGAHNVLISNGHIGGDTDLKGKLIIKSSGNAMDVAIAANATIGVDATRRLKELSFTGDHTSTVAAKVYAQTINYGVTVAAKALTFNAEVKGGADSLLKFTDANAAKVVFNDHAQITNIDFNNFDQTIEVNAKTLTANIKGNAAGADRKGTLILQGANAEFAGVATNLVMIKAADAANTAKIGAGDHTVNELQTLHATGTIEFADGANIKATADANSGSIERTGGTAGKLKFLGSSVIEGSVGANGAVAEITLTGGKDSIVTFQGGTSATDLNIGKGTAALDSTGGARVLTTEVKFTQADAEDSAGTLLIKGANNATITSDIAKANLNRGIVRIDADVAGNVVEFRGQIGDKADANALSLLEIGANTTAQFTTNGNVHINTVKLLGDGIVELDKAGVNFKIGKFENISNNGTLKISNNANLIGRAAVGDDAINFGTSTLRLKEFVINGDRDIEIGDGINIYANKFNNGANNHGKLVFKGTSIFDMAALNTANDKLNTITLDANANVTIASPDTAVNGLTKLGNNSTLVLQGNYVATGGIEAANAGNGTLKFTNNNAATLTGVIGNGGNSLNIIEFAGNDVTFAGGVTTHAADKTFVFSGESAMKVTFDAATNLGNNVFTNNTTTTHTVILANAANNFTKNLSTDVTKQLNFQLANGVDAEISGGDATGTNFTTGVDGKGELNLNKADLVINSVGAVDKSLAKVEFTENATVNNNTYAAEVQVNAGKIATLSGTIKSANFHLDGVDAKAIFADNAKIESVIKSTVGAEGLVEFAGNVNINEDLGVSDKALKKVTFADDVTKTVQLGADVFATDIAMRKSIVQLTANSVQHGAVTTNATTLDLADKMLTLNGDLTVNGVNTIKFAINDSGAALTGGKIVINAGKALAFEADSAIVIAPQDQKASRPTGGASRTVELLKNKGTLTANKGLAADKITLIANNPFITWTIARTANGGINLTQVDNAAKKLKEILASKADVTDNANIDSLANAAQGTDGAKVIDLLGIFAQANNTDKIDETLDRLTGQTTVTDALEDTIASVGESLGVRATSLAGNQGSPVETRTVSSERVTGVSAGDDHARFGAWFSPFFNKTTQKARKGAAGYKSEAYGASFGFDTRANDDMIIGAAVTASNSELKHKNYKSGDKTKVSSLLFSIYGMQQITDTWFALGSATFGTNEVKNREKRVALTGYEIANGKYNSMSFSGEAMFGYNYITEQATLTPMAGLRYTRVNDGGYKESGTTFQNLDVTTKASNKFEVIVGARASGGTFDLNGLTITPEVHGFINYDLINKNPKKSIKLDGAALTAKSNKPVRATYNLGLGANAEYGMMEYGASYDAQLANKRVGHQGTLRLRVNF